MASASPHRRAFAGLLAGLCAVALLFGDVIRGIHLLTAHHVVCLAHGELMEAAEMPHQVAARSDDRAQAIPAHPAVEAHEHCSIAVAPFRSHATRIAQAIVSGIDTAFSSVISCPERPSRHGVEALSYAPKQGPPA